MVLQLESSHVSFSSCRSGQIPSSCIFTSATLSSSIIFLHHCSNKKTMNPPRLENNKNAMVVRPAPDASSVVETVDITATTAATTDAVPAVVTTNKKRRFIKLLKRKKSSANDDGIGSHFGKRAVREAMPQLVETAEKSTTVLAEAIKFTATKGENASVNISKAHKESLTDVMDWVGQFVALYMAHVLRGNICKDWPVLDYFCMLLILMMLHCFFKKVWFPLVLKK